MYSQHLFESLSTQASQEKRASMEGYMKHQFSFIGVPSEIRKETFKEHLRLHGIPSDTDFEFEIKQLWGLKKREINYCAQELVLRKKWCRRIESIALIEFLITNDSWWDTVDFIAASLAGEYFKTFPDKIDETVTSWNNSPNIWLIRSSILFQLKYKEKTNLDLLTSLIIPHISSKEFFIQKAIGWSLRQVSKTNPNYVRQFLESNTLKQVSLREAKKYI